MHEHPKRAPLRVIVADQESAVRHALRIFLTQCVFTHVVADADSLAALMGRVQELVPDLVLVDWQLLGTDGTVQITALREHCPGLQIVVLGLRAEMREAALASGADAYISKAEAPDQALAVLQQLTGGRTQSHDGPAQAAVLATDDAAAGMLGRPDEASSSDE